MADPLAARLGEVVAQASARLRAAGSESARLDAEVLLAHVLGVDRTTILAHPEVPVAPEQLQRFEELLERRARGEPVAYLRGFKEFHGLAIRVDGRALIPRPESELLVDLGLARARAILTVAPREMDSAPFLVWDVGTGSGALAVVLAVRLRRLGYTGDVRFHLSDLSPDALALAIENAVSHAVAADMTFAQGDLLEAAPAEGRVDLLMANLPYVPSDAVPALPVAASFEPRMALDGGPDGITLIDRLLRGLPDRIADGGMVLLEIGGDQADPVALAVERLLPGWSHTLHADLSGMPRVVQLEPTA